MNRLIRTVGIVLKSIRLNESDKIITIFSQDYGKIKGIAKGIRKTKSKFGSSLENLTIVKILAFKGKSLNIITQTEIIHSFFPQSKKLNIYGLAIQCAEIVDKLTVEEDPNEYIYFLFRDTLELLKDEKNPSLLINGFKWKLFELLGYRPVLNRKCILCNCRIEKNNYYNFDIQKGGIICNSCKNMDCNSNVQVKITDYCLRLIKRLTNADLMAIHNKSVLQTELNNMIRITDKYMQHHFEIKNKSQNFIDKINSME